MKNLLKKIYFKTLFIRQIEAEIAKEYSKQEMRCPIHLSIGQELQAVLIANFLKKKDIFFSNHRSHAHYLAKDGSVQAMISELYGKKNGCLSGKGGSMHLIDLKKNFYGSYPIVGSSIGLATGVAFSQMRNNSKNITVSFFGDGATEEGILHESFNISKKFKLPIFYVCENNYYSIYTNLKERQSSDNLTRFAKSHNIKFFRVKSYEITKLLNCIKSAISYVRKSNPFFLQIDTFRELEHCGPNNDDHLNYRNKKNLAFWRSHDPLTTLRNILLKKNIIDQNLENRATQSNKIKIFKIFELAKKSNFDNPNNFNRHLYAKK